MDIPPKYLQYSQRMTFKPLFRGWLRIERDSKEKKTQTSDTSEAFTTRIISSKDRSTISLYLWLQWSFILDENMTMASGMTEQRERKFFHSP